MTQPKLPTNDDAERAVIGAVLQVPDCWNEVSQLLDPEDFAHPCHAAIFAAYAALARTSRPIDEVSVTEELRSSCTLEKLRAFGGADYLRELQLSFVLVANVAYHARLVASKAQRRRIFRAASEIAAAALGGEEDDAFLARAHERATAMLGARRGERGLTPIRQMLKGTVAHLEARQRARQEGRVVGVPTGFARFDQRMGGWRAGELTVIGARPKVGKTSFLLAAMIAAGRAKVPGAVFSAEMPGFQILERALASTASVSSQRIRHGALDRDHWTAIMKAAAALAELPIHIDDDGDATIQDVRARARAWRAKLPDDEVVVIGLDFLQLIKSRTRSKSRQDEVSEVSHELKAMAKELRAAVLALASLNRRSEERDNKRPRASDLRESGSIESDADQIVMMHREEMYSRDAKWKGVAEFIIERNRFGPQGTVKLSWQGEFTKFADLEREEAGADDDEED